MERFTRFIDWPAGAFASGDAPFVIGVIGETAVTPHLRRMAQKRTIKGRTIEIRSIVDLEELDGCHLVFIGHDVTPALDEVLAATGRRPVLTVADTPGFAERGVLINLYLDRARVRFEVNLDAAKRSGLKFSAKLLKLGRIVPAKARQ